MEWLRIQLQILRDRGLKAILMGHVPPARVDGKESWDETCWQKYTLWQRQFRDVIVGNLYGHMNIDHFMLQDFDQISKDAEKGRMASEITYGSLEEEEIGLYEDGEVTVAGASSYLLQLRDAWAQLPAPQVKSNKRVRSNSVYDEDQEDEDEEPSIWSWLMSMLRNTSPNDRAGKDGKRGYLEKIGGKYAERYSVTHVTPSIVPNYFPTLRIIEYNITGLEHAHTSLSESAVRLMDTHAQQLPIANTQFDDNDEYPSYGGTLLSSKKKPKKGPRKYKFKVPEGPSKSSPPGPAYSPQPLTWTRYTQYFANLTRINNDFVVDPPTILKRSKISRSTNEQSPHTIFGLAINSEGEVENHGWKEGKHGKHQGKQPRPEPHPSEFTYEVEYDTQTNKQFPDLTVRRWVEYARKIGQANDTSAEIEEDMKEWEDEEAEEESCDEQVGEDSSRGGGKKHKKKKGKKRRHRKATKEWFTFVRRAFVGTMDPHEIEEIFGTGSPVEDVQEILEL
jgi:endopolyphosphatase